MRSHSRPIERGARDQNAWRSLHVFSERATPHVAVGFNAARRVSVICSSIIWAGMALSCLPLDDWSSYTGTPPVSAGTDEAMSADSASSTAVPLLPRHPTLDAGAPVLTAADPGEPTSVGSEPVCAGPDELHDPVDQACYHLSTSTASWFAANLACQRWGGGLVSINSGREYNLLTQWLPATTWTGANDLAKEGSFVWESGEPFEYEQFAAGEPNNLIGIQDCIEQQVSDGSWHDRDCRVRNRYVCERALTP
jgi:Lectin C-type domain